MNDEMNMSRRIRKSPYNSRVLEAGVRGFTVSNHMFFPKAYQPSTEEAYWHLREFVQVWDVSVQRQVRIQGVDATALVQWMTPRNIGSAKIGDCLYIPIIDQNAGILNDPVLLKISDNEYWLSIADSDLLLYVLGLSLGRGLDVLIDEPDISPLAIQGPKAENVLAHIFGEKIREISFFKFGWFEFLGKKQLIARSGFSRQGGFEVYLDGGEYGIALWDRIMEVSKKYNITPGSPNFIERIEGGLLSYGNEMTRQNNPLEVGFRKYCTLDGTIDFIGLEALQKIDKDGVTREMRGVLFGESRAPLCSDPWPITVAGKTVGQITSGIWSPRLKKNVGLSLIERGSWDIGQKIYVNTLDGQSLEGILVNLPMN